MTHLYLIRHAQYKFTDEESKNAGGDLTTEGIEHTEKLRDRLSKTQELKADILISSSMRRARQTAQIIAPALNLPIVEDSEVEEWRNVTGHGLSIEEFRARISSLPSDQRPFYSPSAGSENWVQFIFRAVCGLNRITQEHAGKNIVVVCHGGVIEAAFLFFCGLSITQPPSMIIDPFYTSITHWEKIAAPSRDRWMLVSYNDTAHLKNYQFLESSK